MKSRGFTLIELLVVLVILAAVAGLVIPKLGYVEDQAGNATAAAASSQLISNLETYKASTGSYPLGLDSLVTSEATPQLYPNLWEHAAGPTLFGPKQYFTVSDMATEFAAGHSGAQSFGHGFAALSTGYYVHDHDVASTDPSNSATSKRTFTSASSAKFAFLKPYSASNPFLTNVYKAAGYPTGTPTGTRIIAFGIGPNAGSIGETMASAPSHGEQESTKYGRLIALFAIHDSGKAASLRTVIDSQGVAVGQNVDDYRKNAPTHD